MNSSFFDLLGATVGRSDMPQHMADVDGDGRADYCRFVAPRDLWCALRTSRGFGGSSYGPGLDPGHQDMIRTLADVNGDGRADYCRFVGIEPERFLSCALSRAGGGFGNYDINSARGFTGLDPGYLEMPRFMADVNGDGRADYCRFVGEDPEIFLSCALADAAGGFGNYDVNSGRGFSGLDPGYADMPHFMVDVNSDGRADFCRFVGDDERRFLSCAFATAAGGFGNYDANSAPGFSGLDPGYSEMPRLMADVSGDGRADFCRFVGDDPAIFFSCALASPSGRFGNYDVNSEAGRRGFDPGRSDRPQLMGDVDGDSREDYCRFVRTTSGHSFLSFASPVLSCALARPSPRSSDVPNFAGVIGSEKMKNAIGVRRVLAILWDPHRPGHPAPPASTIDNLLFGADPSMRDWYRENSGGKFKLVREGVLGWYDADKPGDHYWDNANHPATYNDGWRDGHVEKWAEAIRKADAEFDFSLYDRNHDGTLAPDELGLLIVIPQSNPFGTNRAPAGIELPTREPLVVDGVEIPLIAEWYTGGPANLGAPTHELSHLFLGTPDLYMNGLAWPFAAQAYSLMDISYSTTHFDPFVKLKAGWLNYRVVTPSLASGGCCTFGLRDVETTREAIVLFDPHRGPGEYFVLENRWQGSSYDHGRSTRGVGLPANGLAVWHIIEDPGLLALSNPPVGGEGEWGRRGIRLIRANGGVPGDDAAALFNVPGARLGGDTSPASLRWIDGSRTGFEIELRSGPGATIEIAVTEPE